VIVVLRELPSVTNAESVSATQEMNGLSEVSADAFRLRFVRLKNANSLCDERSALTG